MLFRSAASMSGKGVSFAMKIKDNELQLLMETYTFAYLFYEVPEYEIAGKIQAIYLGLEPFISNIESPPYFDALTLVAMQTLKDTYSGKLSKYTNAFLIIGNGSKDFNTIQIPIMEGHIKYFEGFLDDLFIDFPDFVNAFREIVKRLDLLGKKKQGVEPRMEDAETHEGLPFIGTMLFTNYSFKDPLKKIILTTDSLGNFPYRRLRVGKWTVKLTAVNYFTQMATITVTAKRTVIVTYSMVPVPPPPVV